MENDIPLPALRAFVAVGRQGSFTRAARSLGITQSAVSRHIATLESVVHQPLFIRRGPRIVHTPAGLQLYETVKDAMATLELAVQQMAQRHQRHDRIRVRTSMPSFAMTVIVPILDQFITEHGVQVDLITNLSTPQPGEEFDVLISRDLSLPDSESWELVREELICVGAPSLLARHTSRGQADWPMVASRSRPDLLGRWAVARNMTPDQLRISTTYDHLFFAIAGAIAGAGLLVVPRLLVLNHLRDGTLVPADSQVLASGAYYMAYIDPNTSHHDMARRFCRWLKTSLRKDI